MVRHFNILVSGKVQGVFFRASAKDQAVLFGIKGFVRNESNGDVYIEAEAEENQLNDFLEWCGRGPGRARVDNLNVEEGPLKNFTHFEISR